MRKIKHFYNQNNKLQFFSTNFHFQIFLTQISFVDGTYGCLKLIGLWDLDWQLPDLKITLVQLSLLFALSKQFFAFSLYIFSRLLKFALIFSDPPKKFHISLHIPEWALNQAFTKWFLDLIYSHVGVPPLYQMTRCLNPRGCLNRSVLRRQGRLEAIGREMKLTDRVPYSRNVARQGFSPVYFWPRVQLCVLCGRIWQQAVAGRVVFASGGINNLQ